MIHNCLDFYIFLYGFIFFFFLRIPSYVLIFLLLIYLSICSFFFFFFLGNSFWIALIFFLYARGLLLFFSYRIILTRINFPIVKTNFFFFIIFLFILFFFFNRINLEYLSPIIRIFTSNYGGLLFFTVSLFLIICLYFSILINIGKYT